MQGDLRNRGTRIIFWTKHKTFEISLRIKTYRKVHTPKSTSDSDISLINDSFNGMKYYV